MKAWVERWKSPAGCGEKGRTAGMGKFPAGNLKCWCALLQEFVSVISLWIQSQMSLVGTHSCSFLLITVHVRKSSPRHFAEALQSSPSLWELALNSSLLPSPVLCRKGTKPLWAVIRSYCTLTKAANVAKCL